MRGGAQSQLIEADDGHYYVVKFRENPQHRRILVNEWVAASLSEYLGLSQPAVAVVNLSDEFLKANPDSCIQLGTRKVLVSPGWHFGSRFPGNPSRTAVYDYLPEALLESVVNRREFPGMAAFDKWTANADSRQCIFFRARIREWLPGLDSHGLQKGFVAQMIDHGYIFDGPHWCFTDSPLQGLYSRPVVYEQVESLEAFQPWLERIEHFPEEVLDRAYRSIPYQWLNGDAGLLEDLLEKLLKRRKRVAALLAECREGRVNPFPNWKD
jgi:HipA-like kinase